MNLYTKTCQGLRLHQIMQRAKKQIPEPSQN